MIQIVAATISTPPMAAMTAMTAAENLQVHYCCLIIRIALIIQVQNQERSMHLSNVHFIASCAF